MALNPNDPLDRLYLETIPHRITQPANCHMGPTEQFRLLELDRARWQLLLELGDDTAHDLRPVA